jgi:hypothetical protein
VGSEEGGKCGAIFWRGGAVRAATACAGGGTGGRSGFRRKKTVGRLTGWAERGRERGGPRLGRKGEEARWAAAGPEIGNGQIQEIKSFRILFGIWIFGKLSKFAQGDF